MPSFKCINIKNGSLKTVELTPDKHPLNETWIGRNPKASLVLNDQDVSNLHAKINYKNGSYILTDYSTNGTMLNNKEIEPFNSDNILRIGDTIRIADWLILLEDMSEEDLGENNIEIRCVQVRQETPDVKTFSFYYQEPFKYKPGQFVMVNIPIKEGEMIGRMYSISSSPSRPNLLSITVKQVPNGQGSNWLHNHLKVNDSIKISQPMGHFYLKTEDKSQKILLLSAGSGITPLMSMARYLCDIASDCDIVFFYSVKTEVDLIFREELEFLGRRNPNLHVFFTLTQPDNKWSGLKGRLDEKMLKTIAPDFLSRKVYTCGSDGFMDGIVSLLDKLDFPKSNYYQESFTPKVAKPKQINRSLVPAKNAKSTIVFEKSKITIETKEEDVSILDLAKQNGIKIKSSCLQGVCGVCKVRKISGEVKYNSTPEWLMENQQKQGLILACCSYTCGDLVIDI